MLASTARFIVVSGRLRIYDVGALKPLLLLEAGYRVACPLPEEILQHFIIRDIKVDLAHLAVQEPSVVSLNINEQVPTLQVHALPSRSKYLQVFGKLAPSVVPQDHASVEELQRSLQIGHFRALHLRLQRGEDHL